MRWYRNPKGVFDVGNGAGRNRLVELTKTKYYFQHVRNAPFDVFGGFIVVFGLFGGRGILAAQRGRGKPHAAGKPGLIGARNPTPLRLPRSRRHAPRATLQDDDWRFNDHSDLVTMRDFLERASYDVVAGCYETTDVGFFARLDHVSMPGTLLQHGFQHRGEVEGFKGIVKTDVVRQLQRYFWTVSRAFLSPTPPITRRALRSSW